MKSKYKNQLKNLWIWEEATELNHIVKLLLKKIEHEYSLKNQIDRSSQAIGDNIAEMSGAYYPKVKLNSLRISRKEALETINHIEKFRKRHYWNQTTCDNLINRYNRLIFGINKFISYIKRTNDL